MEPSNLSSLSSNWKALQAKLRSEKEKASHSRKRKRESSPTSIPNGRAKHEKLRSSPSRSSASQTPKPRPRPGPRSATSHSTNAVSRPRPRAEEKNSRPATDPTTSRPADVLNGGLTRGVEAGKYVALDCEMVGVGDDSERSMLARASMVDFHGKQLYDSFVLPKETVTDYRTAVSGITPASIRKGGGARSFEDVQRDIAALIEGRILVGHAVENDLKALILSHPAAGIRDTSELRKYRDLVGGRKPKLRDLAKMVLGVEIQDGVHSSVEDARVTMALFRREKGTFEEKSGEGVVKSMRKVRTSSRWRLKRKGRK